ncbi:MAG: nuclear transport factor 2 family protein [Candidatus Riflebacteria bacterium]
MKTVQETLKLYEIGLSKQSWEAVKDFFHENCTVIFAEATYFGKNQVAGAIQKTFSLIKDESFTLSEINWTIIRESFASCTFNFEWAGTINGKRFVNPGRGTAVWAHENEKWQIVNEHFGPMPR